jgi:hypothetical protein
VKLKAAALLAVVYGRRALRITPAIFTGAACNEPRSARVWMHSMCEQELCGSGGSGAAATRLANSRCVSPRRGCGRTRLVQLLDHLVVAASAPL